MSTTTTSPTANTTTGANDKSHTPVAWKPESDSSPQHKGAARQDGRVHIDITNGACLCGCNQAAESRFRPGHDATLKGRLTRAALHGAGLTLHAGDAKVELTPRQMATKLNTAKHAWDTALDRALARAKQAEADRIKRAAEAKAKREAAAKERGESTKISLADFAA
jgi:hypothetical protein